MIDARLHTRRALMASGGLSVALIAVGKTGLALARDDSAPDASDMSDMAEMDEARAAIKERLNDFTHIWRATSPATHSGDTYSFTVTNVSTIVQPLLVVTTLMDHREHYNAPVLIEELTLAGGESAELEATNTYGVANHFQTTVLANTGLVTDVEVLVVVADSGAVETARFTQKAFMILSIDEVRSAAESSANERRERRRKRRQDRHDHRQADEVATPAIT